MAYEDAIGILNNRKGEGERGGYIVIDAIPRPLYVVPLPG
jgi:hypothetical protein